MEPIEFEGVEVDRCKNCKGIWFDAGGEGLMLGADAAKAIDTGDSSVGGERAPEDRA